MEKLLKQAAEFLEQHTNLNEVELSDGINKVRVVRNFPVVWYYQPQPWTYVSPTTYYPAQP